MEDRGDDLARALDVGERDGHATLGYRSSDATGRFALASALRERIAAPHPRRGLCSDTIRRRPVAQW